MLCPSRFVLLPIVGSLFLGGAASAQTAFPVPATQTAMIETTGPKQGSTAERYFNVEGKTVTLVVAEADPGVAATWSAKSVTLTIKATAK